MADIQKPKKEIDLQKQLESANTTLNNTLVELNTANQNLNSAFSEIEKYKHLANIYRDALIALAKEIN